jgi:type II secretory ATPase GspE/PulE/Tfp pilus assembly ATPase PilB-like protein
VRTICQHCVRTVKYGKDVLISSGLEPIQEWQDFPFREGAGCLECDGTGYRGRTAIHELLDLTDPIRQIILERKSSTEIRERAKQEGMHFLRESALDRVRRGLTTLREINKVTFIETSQ